MGVEIALKMLDALAVADPTPDGPGVQFPLDDQPSFEPLLLHLARLSCNDRYRLTPASGVVAPSPPLRHAAVCASHPIQRVEAVPDTPFDSIPIDSPPDSPGPDRAGCAIR